MDMSGPASLSASSLVVSWHCWVAPALRVITSWPPPDCYTEVPLGVSVSSSSLQTRSGRMDCPALWQFDPCEVLDTWEWGA